MKLTSPGAVALAISKDVNFNFSNTLRNQNVDLESLSSSNFVLDVNGMLYSPSDGNNSSTIIVIGGSDKFVHEKANRLASSYYMSEAQKVTLYKIISEISKKTDSVNISSNNDKLEQGLTSLYRNYCG